MDNSIAALEELLAEIRAALLELESGGDGQTVRPPPHD